MPHIVAINRNDQRLHFHKNVVRVCDCAVRGASGLGGRSSNDVRQRVASLAWCRDVSFSYRPGCRVCRVRHHLGRRLRFHHGDGGRDNRATSTEGRHEDHRQRPAVRRRPAGIRAAHGRARQTGARRHAGGGRGGRDEGQDVRSFHGRRPVHYSRRRALGRCARRVARRGPGPGS